MEVTFFLYRCILGNMKVRFILIILPLTLMLTSCLGMGIQMPAPVSNYGQSPGAGSAGVHNVVKGDTLYSISRRYKIPMSDIAIANKMHAPFKLYEGQRLKLPPPLEYRVRQGDTLYSISRLFGVNQSSIARLNNIRAPYTIRAGQVLRLPSASHKMQMAKLNRALVSKRPQSAAVSTARGSSDIRKQKQKQTYKKPVGNNRHKPSSSTRSHKYNKSAKVPKRSLAKFQWPVRGKIISAFGPKKNGLHNDGINIKAPKGTPVRAAENGVVVYAGNELKGSGNLVLIRHSGGWLSAYAHMQKILITKGQEVKHGQTIGTVGKTGSVSTPQLHFEIRRGTAPLNPVNYLARR